ncbi:MAG TPA: serine/threonine-protein kinase [Polyangiaceae bacterium]
MKAPGHSMVGEERLRLAQKRIGQMVLGKWCLVRLLGVGGMAAVFEAKHASGSSGAVKILHADLASSPGTRERFMAESYAANRVAHAGVVTVRAEGTTDDGAVFLLMDLLRGRTLAERLEAGDPCSVREALDIAGQLLDVLVQAHDRGVVHRDVKPDNVFLTEDARVKLLDFGIARLAAEAPSRSAVLGSALGTPAFMSPEQALGLEPDGRSDLWSLGATLYLMLSGTPVRPNGSVTELLLGAMTRPVPSLGEVAALPRSVVAIVDRALAFDRTQRFPDARSMQLAVLAAREELGGSPDSRSTLPPSSLAPISLPPRSSRTHLAPAVAVEPERRSALPLYVGLGFAVGIGIVVAAQLTVHGGAPTSPVPAAPPALSAPAPASTEIEETAAPQPSGSASALSSARALPNNSK